MESALIGLLGVLLGILITEYLRRRNRIEIYSRSIFEKRLKIYEELYDKINTISSESTDIIENSEYSKDERFNKWSSILLDLARYLDQNKLYVDENIGIHCMVTLIGIEEIYDIKNKRKKEKAKRKFYENIKKAISMIKVETGLKEMDTLFKGITKARHSSDFITEFNLVKEKYQKNKPL
ncbi:hypothetical protein ES702_04026 [subsurface metagenome]